MLCLPINKYLSTHAVTLSVRPNCYVVLYNQVYLSRIRRMLLLLLLLLLFKLNVGDTVQAEYCEQWGYENNYTYT